MRSHPAYRGLSPFFVAALVFQLGLPAGADPARLVPGEPLEREIQKDEAHLYKVDLAAGDFLRVAVDQEGIDVAVELQGPDGRQVAAVDGPGPAPEYGTEDLMAVAGAAGTYQIVVHGSFPNEPRPRYRIRMEAPRPAQADDRRRIEAAGANQDATNLMARQGEDNRSQQVERREKALGIWQELGETAREADTLFQLGIVRASLGETEKASPLLHRAADLYEKVQDAVGQAKALNEAGQLCEREGDTADALKEFEQALELARRAQARWPLVNALTNVARLLNRAGKTEEALADLGEALQRSENLSCAGCQGGILIGRGAVYDNLGDTQKAVEDYTNALKIQDLPQRDRGAAHNNLGLDALSLGDLETALDHFEQAYKANADPQILANQGIALERLGRLQDAFAHYRDAQSKAHRRSDLRTQIYTLHNLGNLAFKMGKKKEAIDAWRQVHGLAEGHEELKLIALFTRGLADRESGDLSAARSRLESALELSRERGDRGWESISELELSQVERRDRRFREAQEHLDAAIAIVESQRNQIRDPNLRAYYLGFKQRFYELAIATAMERHRAEPGGGWDVAALNTSERARARSLLDLLAEFRSELRPGSPAYADLTKPEPLAAPEIQSRVLGEGALLLEYALGEEKSFLWAVSPGRVQSFELPPRASLEKLARDAYSGMMQPKPDPAAGRATLKLSRVILGPVAGMLPHEGTLLVVSDGVLQYIPFAALPLPSSPGELLLTRERIVNLPSASVLAELRKDLAGRPAAAKTLAVLANPVFHPRLAKARHAESPVKHSRGPAAQPLAELPWTEDEAKAIARLVPAPQRLLALRHDASIGTVQNGRLSDYRYVHFATHGVLDTVHPELTRLALSRYDRDGNELKSPDLRLQDIYNLQLNADLVVLSACQTALGKEVRGEGLMGLTRGFMYAGAARVLASLWNVEDRPTSKLMEKLYRYLLDESLPPAEALRRAQLDLVNEGRWSQPYYWAGFSLQGEWR
jgi:CHAT domain-containing protein/tetratricopeptide (TPR) repeat protein